MPMRPMVALDDTTTEFAGMILADERANPVLVIVRSVVLISVMKSSAGKSTKVIHGMSPFQYSGSSDFGVPPLTIVNSPGSPSFTIG